MIFLGSLLTFLLFINNTFGQTETTLHDLLIPSTTAAIHSATTEIVTAKEHEHDQEPEHHEPEHHEPELGHEHDHEHEPGHNHEPEIVNPTTTESADEALPTNMRIIKEILQQILVLDDAHLEALKEILPVSIEVARLTLRFK